MRKNANFELLAQGSAQGENCKTCKFALGLRARKRNLKMAIFAILP